MGRLIYLLFAELPFSFDVDRFGSLTFLMIYEEASGGGEPPVFVPFVVLFFLSCEKLIR